MEIPNQAYVFAATYNVHTYLFTLHLLTDLWVSWIEIRDKFNSCLKAKSVCWFSVEFASALAHQLHGSWFVKFDRNSLIFFLIQISWDYYFECSLLCIIFRSHVCSHVCVIVNYTIKKSSRSRTTSKNYKYSVVSRNWKIIAERKKSTLSDNNNNNKCKRSKRCPLSSSASRLYVRT